MQSEMDGPSFFICHFAFFGQAKEILRELNTPSKCQISGPPYQKYQMRNISRAQNMWKIYNIMGGKTSGEQGLVLLGMASDPAITLAPPPAKKTYHPVHHSQPMNELNR